LKPKFAYSVRAKVLADRSQPPPVALSQAAATKAIRRAAVMVMIFQRKFCLVILLSFFTMAHSYCLTVLSIYCWKEA